MGKTGSVRRDARSVVEASKKMLRFDRLTILLAVLCAIGFAHAIYDPREATTKPPKRREPVLPWYLPNKNYTDSNEDLSRSPKWQLDPDDQKPKKPFVVNVERQTWTPWRRDSNSEIEQRTEIADDRQTTSNFDQDSNYSLEYSQFEQQQNHRFPADSRDLERTEDRVKGGNKEDSQTKKKSDEYLYEGISADSTKPHKEDILLSSKPKLTIARHDTRLGVQCPDPDSTGQFVYPPDCKFFVNCWRGRAFVQPCAPGTLFNPDTLECDFPHKVKCYGGEVAEFPSNEHLDSHGRQEPLLPGTHSHLGYEKLQEPRCPAHITGLIAHPSDCTKFLQCADGGTFIMDCGPGTVFNPAVSVCDWPNNVKGCEDALKSKEETTPLVPIDYDADDVDKQKYTEHQPIKQVACPRDYTGLLPHPETCLKFLQCAHGFSYVMDCGPGTVFNPNISVCDWPYNVRGCEDALKSKEETTISGPHDYENNDDNNQKYTKHQLVKKATCPKDYSGLLPHPETCKKFLQCAHGVTYVMDCGPGTAFNPKISVCDWPHKVPGCSEGGTPAGTRDSKSWQQAHKPGFSPLGHATTTTSTTSRPRTNWDSLRPTWKPSWAPNPETTTVQKPTGWDSTQWTSQPSWQPGSWTTIHTTYSDGRDNDTDDSQGENPDVERQYRQHAQWDQTGSHPNVQWPYRHEMSDQKPNYGDRHHHGHHHRHDESTYSSTRDTEIQQHTPYGHHHTQRSDQVTPDGNWQPGRDYTHHHYHHHHRHGPYDRPHSAPEHDESDQQTQSTVDRFFTNRDHQFGQGSSSPNRRTGQEVNTNRQEYGRNSPGFSQPGYNRVPTENRNTYVDNSYQVPDSTSTLNKQTKNKTIWTHSVTPENRFEPSSWNQGKSEQPSTQPQNRQWDQGPTNEDDKFRDWVSRTDIYQSTADRELDSKLNQWASKTNIFPPKGKYRPGVKNVPTDSSDYPSNVYVNINGTRGHFITKEIEVNEGHSKTRTYSPNNLPSSSNLDKGDQNVYIESESAVNVPSVILQPPDYAPTSNYEPQSSNTSTYNRNIFTILDHRKPKNYPVNSTRGTEDLVGAGTHYLRVPVPSTNLQPPNYSPSDRSPSSSNSPNGNNNYPPVPSLTLEPPIYEPPQTDSASQDGWQYPPVPATDLQPPYYEPSSGSQTVGEYPSGSTNPPLTDRFLDPSEPNANSQNPGVPETDLKPPPYQVDDSTSDFSSPVSSTTQRAPDKHFILPPRKKVRAPQKPLDKVSTTANSNIPSVLVEIEESTTSTYVALTKAPDVTEPNADYDVDVLDDKKQWKPVIVFENKTTTTTEPSVIMKINEKEENVDLFKIEDDPAEKEEPPFPTYYVPSVEPLDHSKKLFQLTPISGQVIRLRGGSGPHDGYVEVQGSNPGWGIVCDSRNSWTLKEAHVVCRQLGFSRGAEMAWQGRNNRNGVPTWIAADTVSCQGNESRFQSCKFTHEPECRVERDAIGVRCMLNRIAHCNRDEIPYEGHCYHLADPDSSLNHAEALDYCSGRQSRLIDITNQAENDFISEWLVQMHPGVGSIMTSGVGFTTLHRTLWVWEDSSRAKFRFTKWWPGWMEDKKHSPIVGSRPLCIVMKRKFPCHERPDSICVADYFFWDTEDCATSMKGHSYICKRPYDDIGCVYGKGSQYEGTANVTASGKDCLSWGDQKVAHHLAINVLNREVREKLQTHNYCRNPNPNRESTPWCFTGPGGERESCDIPPCGNMGSQKSRIAGQCKPRHFECLPGECIPSPWVCDGEEDCTNGADESGCLLHMEMFQKHTKHKLEGHDVEKWLNAPLKMCALRCKEADFTCRSFSHKAEGNVCLLSDSNVGMTGTLKPNRDFDYYEMKDRSMDCEGMFVCQNKKCINQTKVCNGKNDCNDRSDENICTVENLGYEIRLAGSDNNYEGRIEVKILGVWGQVCDDGFGMIDADVICKELGFVLGALEIRPGGYYGNLDPATRFMVDQLRCQGNETSLRECDFEGWGVHNCQPEEAVGVICKTAVDSCPDGAWKCDKSPECIPVAFICDTVVDCSDGSDESSEHCDAPFEIRLVNGSSPVEGRVEVRHHGIWGTVCDDDFSSTEATVICRSLGYGGLAVAKKDGYFGAGEGPIWLDEVDCYGNETQLYRCDHNHWGQHNCDHGEDAGVICTPGDINDSEPRWDDKTNLPQTDINDILPAHCGKRFEDFNDDESLIFQKVVHGSVAPKGAYPWQASIRVRGHSRSSHWCGAVILSPLHVLTAAHCLEGYNKGTYFVRAGDYNTEIDEGTEAEANIEDYYIHEDFRKGHRMNNDIALVLLKGQGIPLGKNIMPICLPPPNTEYPAGLNCTISGFGSIETGKSTHSKDLRYGWVPLLDQSVCRASHVYGQGAISDGMVCAGYLDEGVDTCDGDSGGPLACYRNGAFTLYGITSWGQHCGKANKPGVYVRVSQYRRWIDQKIRDTFSGR